MRFVVVRDNDGGDCVRTKERLLTLCRDAGRDDVLVRIACQELEAWYLGDPDALARAFRDDRLRDLSSKERFRNPDTVAAPARALEEPAPSFQKVSAARLLAQELTESANRSRSFQVFLQGLRRLVPSQAGA